MARECQRRLRSGIGRFVPSHSCHLFFFFFWDLSVACRTWITMSLVENWIAGSLLSIRLRSWKEELWRTTSTWKLPSSDGVSNSSVFPLFPHITLHIDWTWFVMHQWPTTAPSLLPRFGRHHGCERNSSWSTLLVPQRKSRIDRDQWCFHARSCHLLVAQKTFPIWIILHRYHRAFPWGMFASNFAAWPRFSLL